MTANDPNSTASSGTTRKQRRAAERAARKGGSRSTKTTSGGGGSGPSMFVISLAAVGIGLLAVAALVVVSGGFGGSSGAAEVEKPDVPAVAQELRQGRTLVAPGVTPPVEIVAFEDPQCPACGLFTERIEPLIIAEHVANGIASFTYNDFAFLGDESWDAAIAMRVAEDMDGKFWDYQQAVFHNQDGENRGAFSRERLADIAELFDLDREEFLRLMDDDSYRAAVAADVAAGQDLGVNSTPTIIVNGEIVRGVPEWEEFDAIVQAAAEAASAGG